VSDDKIGALIGDPSGVRWEQRYPQLSIGDPSGVRWE